MLLNSNIIAVMRITGKTQILSERILQHKAQLGRHDVMYMQCIMMCCATFH